MELKTHLEFAAIYREMFRRMELEAAEYKSRPMADARRKNWARAKKQLNLSRSLLQELCYLEHGEEETYWLVRPLEGFRSGVTL